MAMNMFNNPYLMNMPGLLGQQQGLLSAPASTQNLMQQYLANLFMRRYQPPALNGAQNTVRSQQGPGGLVYTAPVPAAAAVPAQNGAADWMRAYQQSPQSFIDSQIAWNNASGGGAF